MASEKSDRLPQIRQRTQEVHAAINVLTSCFANATKGFVIVTHSDDLSHNYMTSRRNASSLSMHISLLTNELMTTMCT